MDYELPTNPKDMHRGIFKFVRFSPSGTVLFCDGCDYHVNHSDLVPLVSSGDEPVSAGKIIVKDGKWCRKESGSQSIKTVYGIALGYLAGDEAAIQKAFTDSGSAVVESEEYLY